MDFASSLSLPFATDSDKSTRLDCTIASWRWKSCTNSVFRSKGYGEPISFMPLLHGNFRVSVAVFDAGHLKAYVWHNEMYPFKVEQQVEDHGIVAIPHSWGVLAWHEVTPDGPIAGADDDDGRDPADG